MNDQCLGEMEYPRLEWCLFAQAGANNIAIADEFYKRLEQLKKIYPADIEKHQSASMLQFLSVNL